MPAGYRQESSPGRARGLSSLSPAFLLLHLRNTPEAPCSCHFSAQALQTDTYSRRYGDSSSELLDTSPMPSGMGLHGPFQWTCAAVTERGAVSTFFS